MPKNLDMIYSILAEERNLHKAHEKKMFSIIVMLLGVIGVLIGLLYCDHSSIKNVINSYHQVEEELNGPT